MPPRQSFFLHGLYQRLLVSLPNCHSGSFSRISDFNPSVTRFVFFLCSGDDYKNHVKCVSEEEKYSAKGWTPRANQNKNERKQTEWVEMVQGLANTVKADPALTRVLQTISLHENIPRKKPKFMVYSLKYPVTYSMLITPFLFTFLLLTELSEEYFWKSWESQGG